MEERKKTDPKVWVFDFDETITTAPKQLARLASALKAMGDTIFVLTGNPAPRDDLVKRLTNDYSFPFDELFQYEDNGSDGVARAKYLKQMDAWCGIDNRADRAYTYADVCPHLFLVAKPSQGSKDDAKDAKKDAKKAVKKAKRAQLIDGPHHGEEFEHHGIAGLISLDDGSVYRLNARGTHAIYERRANPRANPFGYRPRDEFGITGKRQGDLSVPDGNDVPLNDPPNLRKADTDNERCQTCWMYDLVEGTCWRYHNKPVRLNQVCDTWETKPDGQE